MTPAKPARHQLVEFLLSMRGWLADPRHREDVAKGVLTLDQFAQELTESAQAYYEMAAWCRLTAGLARGEDVPESVHPQADEDPADTARWQKWRLS